MNPCQFERFAQLFELSVFAALRLRRSVANASSLRLATRHKPPCGPGLLAKPLERAGSESGDWDPGVV